jgi:hypothetical protein
MSEEQQTCVMRNRYNRLQIGSYEFALVYEIPTNNRLRTAARELRDMQVEMADRQPLKRLPMYLPLQTKLLGHVVVFGTETSGKRVVHIGVDACSGKPLHVTQRTFDKGTEQHCQAELRYLKALRPTFPTAL